MPIQIAPPRPDGDPASLPYLLDIADQRTGAFEIGLQVFLLSQEMRKREMPPRQLALGNQKHMYWTSARMVTHHASCGAIFGRALKEDFNGTIEQTMGLSPI